MKIKEGRKDTQTLGLYKRIKNTVELVGDSVIAIGLEMGLEELEIRGRTKNI